PLRLPMRSTTPQASAFAIYRLRSTSFCGIDATWIAAALPYTIWPVTRTGGLAPTSRTKPAYATTSHLLTCAQKCYPPSQRGGGVLCYHLPISGNSSKAPAQRPALSVFAASLLMTAVAGTSVHARDDYPSRPVQMIIPFSAGGPTDIVGRVMGAKMSELLG